MCATQLLYKQLLLQGCLQINFVAFLHHLEVILRKAIVFISQNSCIPEMPRLILLCCTAEPWWPSGDLLAFNAHNVVPLRISAISRDSFSSRSTADRIRGFQFTLKVTLRIAVTNAILLLLLLLLFNCLHNYNRHTNKIATILGSIHP